MQQFIVKAESGRLTIPKDILKQFPKKPFYYCVNFLHSTKELIVTPVFELPQGPKKI